MSENKTVLYSDKIDDIDEANEIIDDEDRVCEWAGCNQHYVGLEALVQHVNSVHVQVKVLP